MNQCEITNTVRSLHRIAFPRSSSEISCSFAYVSLVHNHRLQLCTPIYPWQRRAPLTHPSHALFLSAWYKQLGWVTWVLTWASQTPGKATFGRSRAAEGHARVLFPFIFALWCRVGRSLMIDSNFYQIWTGIILCNRPGSDHFFFSLARRTRFHPIFPIVPKKKATIRSFWRIETDLFDVLQTNTE
jgi:hypothetical protein